MAGDANGRRSLQHWRKRVRFGQMNYARWNGARVLGFTPPGEQKFDEVAREYLERQKVNLTPRAYERESGIVDLHLKDHFSGTVAAIRRGQIERYLVNRNGAGASAYTIRKELQVLKHLFAFAVRMEYIPASPVADVKGPKEPAGRVRYLQKDEAKKLLNHCPAWLTPIVAFALVTAMRMGGDH